MERALELRKEHGSAVDRAEVLDGLGVVSWWESDFDRGEARFREAIELLGQDASERAQVLRVDALANLGGMLVDAGQYLRSAEVSRQALALAEASPHIDVDTQASIWGNLANALSEIESETDAAIEAFDRMLALQREATGEMHPNYAIALNNLGLMHYAQGRHDEALHALERSLEIRRQTLGPEHPQTATGLFNLAGMLIAVGRHAEAEPHALLALEVAERGFEPGHPRIGKAHEKLAQLYQATGRVELARKHAEEALRLYRAAPSVDPAWIETAQAVLDAL
jgi:tetratricopeptide (TPR) repeat protein